MNSDTQWYLGIRGEKTAFQMPWEDDPGVSPAALAASGLGVGALGTLTHLGGAADIMSNAAELKGVREGVLPYANTEQGRHLLKHFPEHFNEVSHRILGARSGGPSALSAAERGLNRSINFSNMQKHIGTAGILGGLGLAGYGAYKELTD